MTTTIAQFGPIGFPELLVLSLLLLIFFGHRLPAVMRSLGRGLIEFKKGLRGENDGVDESGEPRASSTDVQQQAADNREKAATDAAEVNRTGE